MPGCRPLSDTEVLLVVQHFKTPRDMLLFVMGIRTGYRISELLSMKVGHVYQHGRALDYVTVARRYLKGGRSRTPVVTSRTIPLHSQVKAQLEALLTPDMDPEAPLFPSRKGLRAISRTQAYRIFVAAFAAAGLDGKLATHTLRKTFAGRMFKALSRDIYALKKALGHVSLRSTERYLEADQDEINAAITGL